MRFTVVDDQGTVSFVAPGHALKMLAAACSRAPIDHRDLIAKTEDYDAQLARNVLAGLSAFDGRDEDGVHAVGAHESVEPPLAAFRVCNAETRHRSMEPSQAGLVVFNLTAKRIVQVQNSYADLQRRDRGRLWRNGRPVRAFYSYELPAEWSIVP